MDSSLLFPCDWIFNEPNHLFESGYKSDQVQLDLTNSPASLMLWSLVQSHSVVNPLSADCQNVIALGQSVKLTVAQIAQLKAAQCCGVLGVTCVDSKADIIDWNALNLNGTIGNKLSKLTITQLWMQNNNLRGSISSFPSTIQYFSLENNDFTGKLPALPNFYEAYLGNNQFSGKIPALPNTAMYFYVANNKLSGQIPDLPAYLQYLDLQSNNLKGGLPVLPSIMVDLILANNQLKGTLDNLPSTLQTLNLATNSFHGELPALPAGLITLNVYNNDFCGEVGTVPSGIRILNLYNNLFVGDLTVQKPVQLVANINGFTSVNVVDQGQMTVCDVSNNPIWRETLAPLEGNCAVYGTKKRRDPFLVKRSVDAQVVASANNGIYGVVMGMFATVAALL